MTYIDFARNLTRVSLGLAVLTIVLAVISLITRDRRFVTAARRSQLAGAFTVTGAAAGLVAGFFIGEYGVNFIFSYSESRLGAVFKLTGLWAGLDGSILFWGMILGWLAGIVAFNFRVEREHPIGRRLEPLVYIVFAVVQGFFLLVMTLIADPFKALDSHLLEVLGRQGLLVNGVPADGGGLNPLLENYWMQFHPPMMYAAFTAYTVPFAYGIAALLAGEAGAYWIRKTRRWILIAWWFNTGGIIMGGLWAYEVLGWGGYWAWDPVENASFLPWLTGTAFLHSVMIQERRDMLAGWNFFLVTLTFFMSLFGTYLTRSGIVSSVHAFAGGSIGDWFWWFLIGVLGVSIFFIAFRWRLLKSRHTIDSVFSREAVFLLNNLILVGITVAVVILTLFPKLSFDWLGQSYTVGVPVYNLVCTPLFILMLLATAIGPGMGWIRTSPRTMARNLTLPAALSLPLAVRTRWVAYSVIRGGDHDDPVATWQHIYPTFFIVYLSWLIVTSLGWEMIRAIRSQSRSRGVGAAFMRLMVLNNRRYGGYIVHLGLAALGIGIACSSMYRLTAEVQVQEDGRVTVAPYELHVTGVTRDKPMGPYLSTRVHVDVYLDGEQITTLEPEKRFYPRTGYRMQEHQTTEVSIARLLSEDLYIYFEQTPAEGTYIFTIFRNPFMFLIWAGWLLMWAGGLWAGIPLGRKRIGLAG